MQALTSKEQITVERDIAVKTMITDAFRQKARQEDESELAAVDAKIQQLREAVQARLHELDASNLAPEDQQMAQAHLQEQFDGQMMTLLNAKQDILRRQDILAKTANGSYVTTGDVQDTVTLHVGENIYDRLRGAEILVKDGIITAILA
jgi:hypothetical protein